MIIFPINRILPSILKKMEQSVLLQVKDIQVSKFHPVVCYVPAMRLFMEPSMQVLEILEDVISAEVYFLYLLPESQDT